MPKPSKKKVSKKSKSKSNLTECEKYLDVVKNGDQQESDAAFEIVFDKVKPRIQALVNRFNIAGLDKSDILQESLYALRFKAIKDYNPERGHGEGWPPFERFAILCIRRHLSTEYKSSYQNKKRVLNYSMSLNQDTSSSDEENMFLINIIQDETGYEDILDYVENKEYYSTLVKNLLENLSKFEKEVFVLYAQNYSYEEIAEKINENRVKVKIKIKAVDNALSRIKTKARGIIEFQDKNDEDE